MKKYEFIRLIFDAIMEKGEAYSKADAISSDCTRDGLVNRVHIKKLNLGINVIGSYVDNVSITCAREDYSDATDADVRVEFGTSSPSRVIVWANELSDKALEEIAGKL